MKSTLNILQGDCRETLKAIPDGTFHMAVTSPPYWRQRKYLPDGHPLEHLEIGQEKTPAKFVEKLVGEVFSQVHRTLRDDGTLWINIGDGWAASGHGHTVDITSLNRNRKKLLARGITDTNEIMGGYKGRTPPKCWGLKRKDLMMIPFRLAIALQEFGWWVRSTIIWEKPAGMVESVKDRPSNTHEYMFLLTKSEHYFYDYYAIQEPWADYERNRRLRELSKGLSSKYSLKRDGQLPMADQGKNGMCKTAEAKQLAALDGRKNKRTIWRVNSARYDDDHYATYPPELIEPCILAGTSEKGCCAMCGAPHVRKLTEASGGTIGQSYINHDRTLYKGKQVHDFARDLMRVYVPAQHKGWTPGCTHARDLIPCRVLDMFAGSGTTGEVCMKLCRDFTGCELDPKCLSQIQNRTKQPGLNLVT